MRVTRADQWEFDSPSSEEAVEIAVAGPADPYKTVEEFLAVRTGVAAARELPEPMPFSSGRYDYGFGIRPYLLRFAGITLPEDCRWLTYECSRGALDELDLVICAPAQFIHYHWHSTA